MKRLSSYLLAWLAGMTISTAAMAVPLLPGGLVFPAGDTAISAPNTNGVVQNDNLIPFLFGIDPVFDVGGNVQNRVVESTLLGSMVFAPRIRDTFNIAFPGFEILGFRLDGYAGWDTDVGYRVDGLGDKGPSAISRSADGDILTFRYEDPLFVSGIFPGPQEESLFPFIVTNAPDYELTGSMTLFGRNAAQEADSFYSVRLTGLAVPASVPEPSSLLLLGSGLLGLLGLARKGSNSNQLVTSAA